MSSNIKYVPSLDVAPSHAVDIKNSMSTLMNHVIDNWPFAPAPIGIEVKPFSSEPTQFPDWDLQIVIGEFPGGVFHPVGFVSGKVLGSPELPEPIYDETTRLPIYNWESAPSIGRLLSWLNPLYSETPILEIAEITDGLVIGRTAAGVEHPVAMLEGSPSLTNVVTLRYFRDMDKPITILVDFDRDSVVLALQNHYGHLTSRSLVCCKYGEAPDHWTISHVQRGRMTHIATCDRPIGLGSLPRVTFTQFDSILTPSAPDPIELLASESELLNCIKSRLVTTIKVNRLQLVPQKHLPGWLVHAITTTGEVCAVGMTNGPVYQIVPPKRKVSGIELLTLRREGDKDYVVGLNCTFEYKEDGPTIVTGTYQSTKLMVDGEPRWVTLQVDLKIENGDLEVTFSNINFWDNLPLNPHKKQIGQNEKWFCVGYKLTGSLVTENFSQ